MRSLRSFLTVSVLSLIGLTLVSCDGPSGECSSCDPVGSDQGQACADCPDDTGDPPAMGSFTAPQVQLPDGSMEDCTSNLISMKTDYAVPSGMTRDVDADDYDMTFGDFALADENSDGLPVHTSSDSSRWIAPASTAKVEANQSTTPEAPAVSRYVGGETWTCNDSGSNDPSISSTFVMSYLDDGEGQLELEFDGSSMFITGEQIWYTDSDCNNEGRFVSDSQLTYSVDCPAILYHFDRQCWLGEFADRPTDDTW